MDKHIYKHISVYINRHIEHFVFHNTKVCRFYCIVLSNINRVLFIYMRVNIREDCRYGFCIHLHILLLIFLFFILHITTLLSKILRIHWDFYNIFFKYYWIVETELEEKQNVFYSQIRIEVKLIDLTYITIQIWWHLLVNQILGKVRQKDGEFKTNPFHKVGSCYKMKLRWA